MADDTTRYLCAASYLDPGYSKRAITEFLVEPTRPVPPSPGLDAGRVLTEAVRARARRKNYDGLLVGLVKGLLDGAVQFSELVAKISEQVQKIFA